MPNIHDQTTKELRSYKVPTNYTIESIIDYVYNSLKVKDYIVSNEKDTKKPTEFLALALKVNKNQINQNEQNYVILDNKVQVGSIFNYLYLLEYPEELKPNN